MNRGFNMPAPSCGRQPDRHFWRVVSHVGGRNHRLRRWCRMEVERDPKGFGTFQDRPEERVVHVATPDVADELERTVAQAALSARPILIVKNHYRPSRVNHPKGCRPPSVKHIQLVLCYPKSKIIYLRAERKIHPSHRCKRHHRRCVWPFKIPRVTNQPAAM